jgi:hypothetical protein
MVNDLVCFKCKHFRVYSGGCDAFPEGIPASIREEGTTTHKKPLKGQGNKIVFEPFKDESEQLR